MSDNEIGGVGCGAHASAVRMRKNSTVRKLRKQLEASGGQALVLSAETRPSARHAAASQAADDARHAKSSHTATPGAAPSYEASEEASSSLQALLSRVVALEAGQQQLRADFQQGQTDLQQTTTDLQQTRTELQQTQYDITASHLELTAACAELAELKTSTDKRFQDQAGNNTAM